MSEVKTSKTLILPKFLGILAFIIAIPFLILFSITDLCVAKGLLLLGLENEIKFYLFLPILIATFLCAFCSPILYAILTMLSFLSKEAETLKKCSLYFSVIIYIINLMAIFIRVVNDFDLSGFFFLLAVLTAFFLSLLALYLKAANLYLSNSDSNTGNGGTTPVETDVNAVG